MANETETRTSIMQNTVSLFAAKGYDAVGIQEICTASGVTKPTVYYYFGSKAGLLSAIIGQYGGELFSCVSRAAEYRHDFTSSLAEILKAVLAFAKQNPEFFALHNALTNASPESEAGAVHDGLSKKINSVLLSFFRQSSAEMGNMRTKEKLYSMMFLSTCRALAMGAVAGSFKPTEKAVADIIHAFCYGVVQ